LYPDLQDVQIFSAPGRTEVGGNHTDHQHGRVLAAAVNLDIIAVAAKTEGTVVKIKSEGFAGDVVDVSVLEPQEAESTHSPSLVRGVAAGMVQAGYKVGGLCAYTTSNVLKGSGLSSSAAFEVLVGTLFSYLYNDGAVDAVKVAQIGQYAENVFFGKPSGLMDQTASSVGGFITIDFADPAAPVVEKVPFDFAKSGYRLCIVNTGGNHADLTPDYAAVPAEMKAVAELFGKEVLREVDPAQFMQEIARVRAEVNDRAALRSLHFFAENARVEKEVAALQAGDFETFKQLILDSGRSSYCYLQNVYSSRNPAEQGISLALALSEQLLQGKGAWRVHGGGFAGTIQAFVPESLVSAYVAQIESVFGRGSCHLLSIRAEGGIQVLP
jgi:galactokinase